MKTAYSTDDNFFIHVEDECDAPDGIYELQRDCEDCLYTDCDETDAPCRYCTHSHIDYWTKCPPEEVLWAPMAKKEVIDLIRELGMNNADDERRTIEAILNWEKSND